MADELSDPIPVPTEIRAALTALGFQDYDPARHFEIRDRLITYKGLT